MSSLIHPTAIVSSSARIGSGVSIGAFSVIEDDVEIGEGTKIRASVYLANGARIGKNCDLYQNVTVGNEPQDLKFPGGTTYAIVGDQTVLRECVSVHRGTHSTGKTTVGTNCYIMAYSHVAHDCTVGNNVIFANATQIAGHTTIEDTVIFGGATLVHQFCRVGKHCMTGGGSKLVKDVAPFTIADGNPALFGGVNKIGLKRRGFSDEDVRAIVDFYHSIMRSGLNVTDGIAAYRAANQVTEHVQYCIDFIAASKRGIHRG